MNIKQALQADQTTRMALVGAGGKTSTMLKLASYYSGPVMLSSSTHLGREQVSMADRHVILTDKRQVSGLNIGEHEVLLVTGDIHDQERVSGVEPEILDAVFEYCNQKSIPLIIEADGSKRLPLKAPAEHEPAIPEWVNSVVVIAGLSGLNRPLNENLVHRPGIFKRLTGISDDEPVTIDVLIKMLLHSKGGLKNIPESAEKRVLFTQIDRVNNIDEVKRKAESLCPVFDAVVFSQLNGKRIANHNDDGAMNNILCSVYEPVAGIILAAGGATRYGDAKVLLNWHGKPFVRQVVETALEAKLSPIFVVVGAIKEPVFQALEGLPVKFVENQQWETGQSSSVIAGIKALPPNIAASIVLLADQPHIPVDLIDGLLQIHRNSHDAVIAPSINGQRANPVILDRQVFSSLIKIRGDQGARSIFSQFTPTYLPWHDESLLLDVDTPEDYRKLLDLEKRRTNSS